VFVHISAFPRDGSRPTVGETLSYEVGEGQGGKPQAVRVVRAAVGVDRPPSAKPEPARSAPARLRARTPERKGSSVTSRLRSAMAVVAMLAVGAYAFQQARGFMHRAELASQPAEAVEVADDAATESADDTAAAPAALYRCDGRTQCSQMTSCDEARWFINHCPGTQMDGDGDGEPCEQQWCGAGS